MRAPWVIAGTVAGLAGLLAFQSTPVKVTLAALPTTQPTLSRGTTTTQPSSATRTAVGANTNYFFGSMTVAVTVKGARLVQVRVSSLNDGGNSRSQSIDQGSIPFLEQEAIAAQSANIQSVSGASYTSAGFAQSLQSALGKLGL
jgi:uncharacterized protein with FMN-binding domain